MIIVTDQKGAPMYNIYYAHHQWKYGTQIEQYELDLIKRYFPDSVVFNPATELLTDPALGEEAIMKECLDRVRNSDIIIFSSMDGVIGTGVYHELEEARKNGKFIYYIYHNALFSTFNVSMLDDIQRTDRVYALTYMNSR